MLQDIRENSQGVVAKIIIGLIVAVFALTGMEMLGGGLLQPEVAEVNGEEITQFQLDQNVQNLLASVGGQLEGIDQGLLESIALNQLIEETILRQQAFNTSMVISNSRLDRNILATPSFQVDGVFNSDMAIRTMAAQGLNVDGYRQLLTQNMLVSQMASAYTNSNFVTESELNKFAELTAQSRDFRYLSVTLGTRTLGIAISDEEISEYYENNPDAFIEEETVIAEYVILDKDVISQELDVNEGEILAQYEAERSEYEGSSEKRAAHILFEVGFEYSEEEALELATTTQQRLADGEDFAALALELSSDIVSGEEGGDIGYTDGTAFPAAIEEALETLALDEVSVPVVSEFGVHLVKLTEDAENIFATFEEARDRIERDLKSSEVELIYGERLQDLSNLAFETGDLQTISEELGLEISQSEPIGRSGGSNIFSNPSTVDAVFSDEVLIDGNNSDVIELSDLQSVVVRVTEFNEAAVLPLEEVQPEIAVILRTEMERQAIQDLGNQLAEAADAGEGLEELLAENELEWIEETEINRDAFTVNREVLDAVFALQRPQGEPELASITLSNGTFVLVELNQVNEGTIDSIPEEEREEIVELITTDLGNSEFQAYLNTLRENSDIQANLEDFGL
jgi:peptidyl-prolyl cis-trans isomerase D